MKSIGDSLNKKFEKKGKRPTERGSLLELFTEEINSERRGTKYKPILLKFVAVKTAHLSLQDLYFLKSTCEDAKRRRQSFSKVFFGSLKPRDPNDF